MAFPEWLATVGDKAMDVGGDVALLWAEKEFAQETTQVEKAPAAPGVGTATAPVYQAGQVAPVSPFVSFGGLPLDPRFLWVGGVALGAAVLVRLLR